MDTISVRKVIFQKETQHSFYNTYVYPELVACCPKGKQKKECLILICVKMT